MARGIVKITPKKLSDGQVELSSADSNKFGVKALMILEFHDPGFVVKVGDSVECTILSETECEVLKVDSGL